MTMTQETSADPDTVLTALIDATAQVLGLEPADISPDGVFGDLDVDSVHAVEIVVQLGDTLGTAVDARELLTDWTDLSMKQLAADLAEALARQAGSGPGTRSGGGT